MSLSVYVGVATIVVLVRLVLRGASGEGERGERVNAATPDSDDPRWGGSRGRQIAGVACAECHEKLIAEAAGAACAECEGVVHRKRCAKLHRARAHGPRSRLPYR